MPQGEGKKRALDVAATRRMSVSFNDGKNVKGWHNRRDMALDCFKRCGHVAPEIMIYCVEYE